MSDVYTVIRKDVSEWLTDFEDRRINFMDMRYVTDNGDAIQITVRVLKKYDRDY